MVLDAFSRQEYNHSVFSTLPRRGIVKSIFKWPYLEGYILESRFLVLESRFRKSLFVSAASSSGKPYCSLFCITPLTWE